MAAGGDRIVSKPVKALMPSSLRATGATSFKTSLGAKITQSTTARMQSIIRLGDKNPALGLQRYKQREIRDDILERGIPDFVGHHTGIESKLPKEFEVSELLEGSDVLWISMNYDPIYSRMMMERLNIPDHMKHFIINPRLIIRKE